jgi:prepilin-type processing-associated H-X9-DG protein
MLGKPQDFKTVSCSARWRFPLPIRMGWQVVRVELLPDKVLDEVSAAVHGDAVAMNVAFTDGNVAQRDCRSSVRHS